MGIRESKTAVCDRCQKTETWEKQWELTSNDYARATLAPVGWAWVTVTPEPGGAAKWRALLCVPCVEALDDWVHE